eukprot:GHUV01040237.1.p1 GENE.GHUV01040237.1~~GHUV01040237.1.p1  ORF type:complete len:690 (+),score=95.53 GHUV01040237.1:319-2388(+)
MQQCNTLRVGAGGGLRPTRLIRAVPTGPSFGPRERVAVLLDLTSTMPSQTLVQHFVNELKKLQDHTRSYSDRYFTLDDLCSEAGYGQGVQEFCLAGGPRAIVEIAVRHWPADGKLSSSAAAADVVEVCHHDECPDPFVSDDCDVNRSLRRTAIGMLAEMSNYKPYVLAMEKAGMFAPEVLPRMLEQTMAQLDFPVHNKGLSCYEVKDQTQAIAVHLLNLAANALVHSIPLRIQLVQHTALKVCTLYQDPYSQFVAKSAAERAAERAKLEARGLEEKEIEKRIHKLTDKQQKWEKEKYDESEYSGTEVGGLHYYFIRFINHLVQCCPEDQLLRLIHEGGLISKLRGNMSPKEPSMITLYGPHMAVIRLTEVWTKNCYKLSDVMYQRVRDDEDHSLELRLDGNGAFRGGELQKALDCYWKAIALNPEDSSLYNNISLVYAKMGDSLQALYAAEESLKVDPAVSKSWARLGDAYRMMERWQLAHLAYTAALEMMPNDADILARQSDARSHLAQVWDIDRDVPDGMRDFIHSPSLYFKWLGLGKDDLMEMYKAGPDQDDFIDSLLERREGHSRHIACTKIKEDVKNARALAVATGLLKPETLPACCKDLVRIEDLPRGFESWTISWTDTPLRHKQTGLNRHTLTAMSGSRMRSMLTVLGTPGVAAVRKLLISGMTNPMFGQPERPTIIFVAHR